MQAGNKKQNTFIDIFSNVLVDIHAIGLIKCNFVRVEDIDSTSYRSKISCKYISLGKSLVEISRADESCGKDGNFF